MYQLLISDFDGTLIDSDEAIPLSTMVEIDRIRRSGVKFVVATNRILKSILEYNRDFPFLDYVISCDGAYVYDVCRRKSLVKKPVPGSILKKIKKLYSGCRIYFCTLQEEYLCMDDVVCSEVKKRRIDFLSFYEANKNSIYKMILSFTTKKMRNSVLKELEELKINASFHTTDKKKDYRIEVMARDARKVFGIEKICKKEKVSLEQVVFLGDSDEDIPIFLSVGKSIAVSNGSRKAKKQASMVTSSNETKGVEKAIKKLF